MPVNKRFMGNVATEEVVHLLRLLDLRTGIDFDALREVARDVARLLGIEPVSPALAAGTLEEMLEGTRGG